MKKLFLVAFMAILSSATFAQSGKWAAGLNIGYGSDIEKPSIGIKALYDLSSQLTLAPSFNYYFKQTEKYDEGSVAAEGTAKFWDINCDLHWNVYSKENFKFYPFVGLTYMHGKAEATASASGYDIEVTAETSEGKVGANVGIGGQLNIASNWAVGLEVKYQIIDGSQVVPALSILYRF